MSRFLLVDIGAGTMDVLYYDMAIGVHYKAVCKSPVRHLAEYISTLSGKLLVVGTEMGGGEVSNALRRKAKESEVVLSSSAAHTLHHDVERVRSWGFRVVSDPEADGLVGASDYQVVGLSDLDLARIKQVMFAFGCPFEFDVVGICAQDHGMAPPGTSHLDYRHNMFKSILDIEPYPSALLFDRASIPPSFNRLRSLAGTAVNLPAAEIYVMDSGMAAILGASLDSQSLDKEKVILLDVATSHTVGAALEHGEIAAFFEYHTADITLERLETLLHGLAEGELVHDEILKEGGHGAYTRKALGFAKIEAIIATGPKRGILRGSNLPIVFGAPWGDNMMTGTVGLLEAIRRRKEIPPIDYL